MANWNEGYQVWLTESQMLENAQIIVSYFINQEGSTWTSESLSALLGNMAKESSINPNMYEFGYSWSADRGYGLVQWTPRSKFWDWAINNGLEPEKAESQLKRLDYEVEQNIQWFNNRHALGYGLETKYDFSFFDFRNNTHGLSVDELTEAFMWNYEAPAYQAALNSLSGRIAFSKLAYETLDFTGAVEGGSGSSSNNNENSGGNPTSPGNNVADESLSRSISRMVEGIISSIEDMLTVDIYDNGAGEYYSNDYITIHNQLGNMYKIKPNLSFLTRLKSEFDLFNRLNDALPVNSNTDDGSSMKVKPYFPLPSKYKDYIMKEYNPPENYYEHYSIDNKEEKIYATNDGEIVEIGDDYLVLKERDYYIKYENVKTDKNVSDKVKRKDEIGVTKKSNIENSETSIFRWYVSKTTNFASEEDSIDPQSYLNDNIVINGLDNDDIRKVIEKALSYPDNSVPYSMEGTRDMISSGDCSSFINACFSVVGLYTGGWTGEEYTIARDNGWIVQRGTSEVVEDIINSVRAGDFVIMSEDSATHSSGGGSHVVLMISDTLMRHQSAYPDWRGPKTTEFSTYARNLRDGGYPYWSHVRPIS